MKSCNPCYLAVIILALSAALTACENYNQSLKPEIEYNGSVEPAHSAADLRALINAIPAGGSGTVTVMESFAIGATVEIGGGRAVTVEAYSGTTITAVLTRGANFGGAFFDVKDGASLSLRGGREKGTLILDGGAVWDADHTTNSGRNAAAALVTVGDALNGGVLTLGDRATLRNNALNGLGTGGGVAVTAGGVFTMTGGTIAGNTANDSGGGVLVYGSFTMEGGTIARNTAANGSGGGVYYGTGSFIMKGGSIAYNTSGGAHGGGGVYVDSGNSFTMEGGTISGNTAANVGGGVLVAGGGFTMTGGEITGNIANGTSGGGGVLVWNGGSFAMQGGTIADNTAANGRGGGVNVDSGSSFAKSGGIIYGSDGGSLKNTAVPGGHAVQYDSGYYRNATLGEDDDINTVDTSTNWGI